MSYNEFKECCEKYSMNKMIEIFELNKPQDFYNFIKLLYNLNMIDNDKNSLKWIIEEGNWNYSHSHDTYYNKDKSSYTIDKIEFTISNYDVIIWDEMELYIKPEMRGDNQTLITNEKLFKLKDIIISARDKMKEESNEKWIYRT